MTKLAYSVPEASEAIGVCERTLWNLIRDGEIKATRIRRRVVIEADQLQGMLARGRQKAEASDA